MVASLIVFGGAYISPALIGFMAEKGICCVLLNPTGKFQTRIEGPVSGDVLLRRAQYKISDPINALLSFLYTLLVHDCRGTCEAVGLDPAVGFLHRDRPGRLGLALDLMEELRPVFADRLALSLLNRRQIDAADFKREENGAVIMRDAARKTVLAAWRERKKEERLHEFLGEKIPFGLVPFVQAQLLARHLRGDIDAYPSWFWK